MDIATKPMTSSPLADTKFKLLLILPDISRENKPTLMVSANAVPTQIPKSCSGLNYELKSLRPLNYQPSYVSVAFELRLEFSFTSSSSRIQQEEWFNNYQIWVTLEVFFFFFRLSVL